MSEVVRELVARLKFTSSGTKKIDDINEKLETLYEISSKITKELYKFGKAMFNQAGVIEQVGLSIEVMTGSLEVSQDLIEDLQEFAKKTPFQLTGLLQNTKHLLAFNFEANEIIKTMHTLGTVASATGANLTNVVMAYGKMKSRGVATMLELNSLIRNGVPILDALSKKLGVTGDELRKMIQNRQVSFKDIEDVFKVMETTKFKGMLERQAGTYLGILQNIADSWDKILTIIGRNLMPVMHEFFGAIMNLINANEELISSGIEYFFRGLMMPILALAAAIELVVYGIIWFLKLIRQSKLASGLFKVLIPLLASIAGLLLGLLPILAVVLKFGGLLKVVLGAIALIVGFIGIKLLLIVGAIALVIAGFMQIIKYWDEIKDFFIDVLPKIAKMGMLFAPNIVGANEIEKENKATLNPSSVVRSSNINNTNNNSKKEVNVNITSNGSVDLTQRQNMERIAKAVFEEKLDQEQSFIHANSYSQE